MVRERTLLHLVIGLLLSLSLHGYLVIWGPAFFAPPSIPDQPAEVEVQLRDWPASPVVSPLAEPTKSVEPPPPARPAVPPDTVVLQEAERAALTPPRPDQAEIRLPAPPPPSPPASTDPVRVAQALIDALQTAPPPLPPARLPALPDPERRLAERRELPPLPALGTVPRPPPSPSYPVITALPSPGAALRIQGPAADRQVIFQPPPPTATVEGETEIELQFWIAPDGTVSRVVPLKKSDARLEVLATNYLRQWRFNPLPPGLARDEQWGIIPFKFRIR